MREPAGAKVSQGAAVHVQDEGPDVLVLALPFKLLAKDQGVTVTQTLTTSD